MTETKDIKSKDTDIREMSLEPGIYDLTLSIREYLENSIPIPDEELNVLRTFDPEYSFEQDIQKRGRQVILSELDDALKYFDFEEAKLAAQEGMKMAQIINPNIPIKPFPIVFLFIPHRGDAKALYGQGCGINIVALKNKRYDVDPPREKIVSFTAHETVHTFLKQLGKQPKPGHRTWQKVAWDFIWEEGLATYVEPTHYFPHGAVESDGAFWVNTINRWFKSQSEEEVQEIFEEIKARPSFQTWYNYMYYNKPIPDDFKLSNENFLVLLRKRNGLGYHVGSYLWKKQLEEAKQGGKGLKDLVMIGSDQMEIWMRE